MNAYVYIGIILFAMGLFAWLFAVSKLRGLQSSFIPVAPTKIRTFQIISWMGVILFIGGITLAICTFH